MDANTTQAPKTFFMMLCSKCGSQDIEARADSLRWNVTAQRWEFDGVVDEEICCYACQDPEATLLEVPVELKP